MSEKLLLIATSNPGKLREYAVLLAELPVRLLSLRDVGLDSLEVEEPFETFEENAVQKAKVYAKASGLLALADDTGLVVDALGGRPGVYSARFAGEPSTDEANNILLLEKLKGISNRAARYVCVIALVKQGTLLQTFRGTVEGEIRDERKGSNGFGYDPMFYCPAFNCTFGEATTEMKLAVSHRGVATLKMLRYLKDEMR